MTNRLNSKLSDWKQNVRTTLLKRHQHEIKIQIDSECLEHAKKWLVRCSRSFLHEYLLTEEKIKGKNICEAVTNQTHISTTLRILQIRYEIRYNEVDSLSSDIDGLSYRVEMEVDLFLPKTQMKIDFQHNAAAKNNEDIHYCLHNVYLSCCQVSKVSTYKSVRLHSQCGVIPIFSPGSIITLVMSVELSGIKVLTNPVSNERKVDVKMALNAMWNCDNKIKNIKKTGTTLCILHFTLKSIIQYYCGSTDKIHVIDFSQPDLPSDSHGKNTVNSIFHFSNAFSLKVDLSNHKLGTNSAYKLTKLAEMLKSSLGIGTQIILQINKKYMNADLILFGKSPEKRADK